MNSIRIKWPTGHTEARADARSKGKAEHSLKRASSLRHKATDEKPNSKERNAYLRDASYYRGEAAAFIADANVAREQTRAMKAMPYVKAA